MYRMWKITPECIKSGEDLFYCKFIQKTKKFPQAGEIDYMNKKRLKKNSLTSGQVVQGNVVCIVAKK